MDEGALMEVIYCQVNKNNSRLSAGHWFFHTGRWVVCAEAIKLGKHQWELALTYAPNTCSIPNNFRTLTELKEFVSGYYGLEVVRGGLPDEGDL